MNSNKDLKNMNIPLHITFEIYHELERTHLVKNNRQGISRRYTEYSFNAYYC